MKPIADGVYQLWGIPRHYLNVYLVHDVLIDAGTRWGRSRILRQLQGRPLRMVALTHCHPDHQGAVRLICRRFHVPLACHEGDVATMEGRAPMLPDHRLMRLGRRFLGGPPYPVRHILREGDLVAGFRIVHAPGHTPGHIIFFRDADRVAIAGDVLANIHLLTGEPGLRLPPPQFCVDARQNRQSIDRLVDLRPSIVCFGHGPPLLHRHVLEDFAGRLRHVADRSAPAPAPSL